MKIHELNLRNFKSFRKADIPFANGFTCIVGANGSGKSNILDALLFVFGTHSLKLLRANKLTELVNYNAEDGQARVRVEVRKSGQKYEISRTIDRQGKSVFRLNEKRASLNEVASLLNELGVNPDGYNIVVQGDITRIIQMNPKERREIIDEVAGIREFDEKKGEALKELQKVDDKIREVRIVLNERENYLQELQKEREAAQRYSRLQTELKSCKASLLRMEVNSIAETQKEVEEKERKASIELQKALESRAEIAEEVNTLSTKGENLTQQWMKEAEKTFEGFGKELEEQRGLQKLLQERIENAEELKEREFSRLKVLEDRQEDLKKRLQQLETGKETLLGFEFDSELERELHDALHAASALHGKIELEKEALKFLKQAQALCPTCEQKLDETRKQRTHAQKEGKITTFSKEREQALQKVKELEKKVVEMRGKEREFSRKKAESEGRKSELEMVKRTLREAEAEGKNAREVLEESENESEQALKESSQAGAKVKELELEVKKRSEKQQELEVEKNVVRGKLEEASKKKEIFDEKAKKLEISLSQYAVEKSKDDTRRKDLEEELKEFENVELVQGIGTEELRKKVPKIERELHEIGAVNLKALEGFETHSKELEEIRQKAQKLEEERISVLGMIDSIEIRRKEVFFKAFNAVQENFSKIFFSFFGGEGKLSLTETENPLEAGLGIEAHHKSEKMKSIDLMSGGEKTLTALAFLFAIQLYNPSPFYVFDEADAALDNENSLKLAHMIQQLSKDKQFIAITHNDLLVKKADQIVGVALNQQKSSVIGLKLEEQVKA